MNAEMALTQNGAYLVVFADREGWIKLENTGGALWADGITSIAFSRAAVGRVQIEEWERVAPDDEVVMFVDDHQVRVLKRELRQVEPMTADREPVGI